jgi:hypothetical protein
VTRNQGFAAAAIVAAAVAVVLGFWDLGTPAYQRRVGFDQERVQDLSFLRGQIAVYYAAHKRLPPSLVALPSNGIEMVDPATGKVFAYQPSAGDAYQLCADFSTNTTAAQPSPGLPFRQHLAGHVCFRLRAAQ